MSKMEDRLVYMANQIGKAFILRPHQEAVDETATHLKAFWEKRMLTRILAYIDAGGAGLDEIPRQALLKFRENLPK
ncbi:MAG TPA: formate dehydrogenase subunit delta [Acidocella sp.]|jgi:formate dehydrogenase subunit delta|uniref:formate dehydrogenase subunit delta n=1 Tax=Acidocella sp. TaxID=50710 RepID=UPI002B861E17|nr:formate dehydrogenase subunit delta [Acidocella sp.]HVE21907.1 formate dehydrogenase subunit delta [Acidocella sp.]